MPRQSRLQSPTGYYHVMIRGNNRENIFGNVEQKLFFFDILKEQLEDSLVDIVAYCLMDNHVHILAKTEHTYLAKVIKSINVKFAMKFNKQHDRVGHVFQDRYRSEPIANDKYLLQVIRYIHNNPVKAGMVKEPQEYYFSSFNEYINDSILIRSLMKDFVLAYFNNDLDSFIDFHKQVDNREYLEIKEDIKKQRIERGQKIISEFFETRGLLDAKQIIQNPSCLEELIRELLDRSKLSHRQIARLIGISNNMVHKVSLDKEKQ